MINNKKVTVVLPAYNAAKTLEKTIGEIPFDIVDDCVTLSNIVCFRVCTCVVRSSPNLPILATNLFCEPKILL